MRDPKLDAAIRLYDRFTHEGLDRRAFMTELTRVAGGAAAAGILLSSIEARAQPRPQVAENDRRLTVLETEWPAAEGRQLKGYLAQPLPLTERPLVLVIHENRGLNSHIRDVTRRLAIAGFAAVAPDFLTSQGGTPSDEDAARAAIGRLDLAAAVADAAATLSWFRNPRSREPRRIGAVGFCWGGGFVNRLAVAAGAQLDAAVSFYGPAPSTIEAPRVEAPMLIHLAERDERVNATALPWVAALRNAGKSVRAIDYHGVDHAFHNDTSAARYDRRAAERAWATTLDFFREHLRGRG